MCLKKKSSKGFFTKYIKPTLEKSDGVTQEETNMTNPLLRKDIQPITIMVDGRQMIMFTDPLKFAPTGYAIDCSMIPLLNMLNGSNGLKNIQSGLMRFTGGTILPIAALESFIAQLDNHYLLESETFRRKKNDLIAEFAQKIEREPQYAGTSYNADPDELLAFFARTEAELPPLPEENTSEVIGVLAPHIDIHVARHAYVDAYRRLKNRKYDLVIIFGINHCGGDGLFSLTDKDFITPLGKMKADKEFISAMKQGLPEGTIAEHDFDHMMEHSIEFQTIFLAHYLDSGAKIVPVLCNGIHTFLQGGKDPFKDRRFLGFRDSVADLIKRQDRKVLLVSGVDFSHIGHKFGHGAPSETLLPAARANDELLIARLMECSADGIFRNALDNHDKYNVCGLSSMLIFASLLGPCRAELLHHNVYEESATRSAVTYASMIFHKQES
jgi:MEMO1 family protein